jgi:hypothetical protein
MIMWSLCFCAFAENLLFPLPEISSTNRILHLETKLRGFVRNIIFPFIFMVYIGVVRILCLNIYPLTHASVHE